MLRRWWSTVQQLLRQRGKNPNRLEEEEYKLVYQDSDGVRGVV